MIYVVEMLRWGDRERHSYIAGVYDTYTLAVDAGKAEVMWRGGKYEYYIDEHKLNYIDPEKLEEDDYL